METDPSCISLKIGLGMTWGRRFGKLATQLLIDFHCPVSLFV